MHIKVTFLCTQIFGGNILYISYSGKNHEYATAALSKRDGKRITHEYFHLGRVIDREVGIYENRDMGIFTFDPVTCHFGVPKEEPVAVEEKQEQVRRRRMVDFGDSYFFNEFLYKSGLMSIVDKIEYKNLDTLHAMLLFYSLSSLANYDAIHWYSGNIVHLLYPNANITSQRISEFLSEIGSPENRMIFQEEYINFVMKYYSSDKNILIDSTGLPNSINFPLTCKNVHNGKLSNEIRLIFVVQKHTGLPIFYYTIPGNIVDVSTLKRIFIHLEELGIDIDSCIFDAGYNSDENIDLFYDENHNIKIGFIIRTKSSCKIFKDMIRDELDTLELKENFVKYEDRYLFIKKKEVSVGVNKNNSAWLYLGLDRARMHDEYKNLVKKAKKNNLSNEDVFNALQTEGLFGILSNRNYSCEEILPAYYQRQAAEQIFDFSKNYTKLLPIRTYTEETFQGHLLLSYIASCAVKLIQLKLQVANLFFGSRLAFMRNQKCFIHKRCIITDPPQKEASDTYKCFEISCPESIKLEDGKLKYTPSLIDIESVLPKKKRQNVSRANTTREPNHTSPPIEEVQPLVDSTKRPPETSTDTGVVQQTEDDDNGSSTKRGRGRPKGSKNKKTLEREAAMANQPQQIKRGRGRPKGSKNKKTLEREEKLHAASVKATKGQEVS